MKTLKALLLLAVVLSVDHSVTADPIPDPNSQDLLKRSVLEFNEVILCNMPNSNPYAYTDYGCYCGYGGKGTPVDDLDSCCQVHDECYGKIQKHPKCDSFFGKYVVPYIMSYVYTCDKEKKKATCSKKTNNECQTILCECDRVAAECFANTTYNDDYWDLDQKHCKQG